MILYHHTTRHAVESIVRDGHIVTVFDYVWLTLVAKGENTAGIMLPDEHKGRITVDLDESEVRYVNAMMYELPHLNFRLLNAITDTNNWYLSEDNIPDEKFLAVEVMEHGKWVKYKGEE